MTATRPILVAGSVNRDLRLEVSTLPRWGETVLAAGSTRMIGGKGANQAIAAARAGGSVGLAATVGHDGRELVARLAEEGIDTRHVVVSDDAPTGVAVVVVDQAGENLIVVDPAANRSFTGARPGDIGRGAFILMQGETPAAAVVRTAAAARDQGGTVVLNAAPAGPWVHDLAGKVDHLIVNEGEFATIFARPWDDASPAGDDWPSIVVTRGGEGSVWLTRGERHHVAAQRTSVRDTVGAGDAFCGALVAELARDRAMEDALRAATIFAAAAVRRVGAADSYPTREEYADLVAAAGLV